MAHMISHMGASERPRRRVMTAEAEFSSFVIRPRLVNCDHLGTAPIAARARSSVAASGAEHQRWLGGSMAARPFALLPSQARTARPMRKLWKDSAIGFIIQEIVRRPLGLIVVGLILGMLIGLLVLH